MSLNHFTSTERRNWMNINCNTIECSDFKADSMVFPERIQVDDITATFIEVTDELIMPSNTEMENILLLRTGDPTSPANDDIKIFAKNTDDDFNIYTKNTFGEERTIVTSGATSIGNFINSGKYTPSIQLSAAEGLITLINVHSHTTVGKIVTVCGSFVLTVVANVPYATAIVSLPPGIKLPDGNLLSGILIGHSTALINKPGVVSSTIERLNDETIFIDINTMTGVPFPTIYSAFVNYSFTYERD